MTTPSNPPLSFSGATPVQDAPLSELLVAVRRHLHRHPELGLQEFATSAFIRDLLERNGLSVVGPLAGTGLYVDIHGDLPGPTVAYRADIDALPIQDRKSVEYVSTVQGVAHLCGHDGHTSIALGVALLASGRRADLPGTIRVFFQPNEEGIPTGSPLMIRDGVLDGVEAVFASHVDPTLELGRFGFIVGAATASADRFRIHVDGPSTGHSARPHQVADTVWVTTQIMNALYQQVGRRTDARNPSVFTITRIHAGDAYNVIPESVEFGGTLRCTVQKDRALLRDLMEATARAIAGLYGAEVRFEFDAGSPPVTNDRELIALARSTAESMFGPGSVYDIPLPSMGAEDFAYYQQVIPGALIRVGTSSGPDTSHVLHDSCFDLDERALEPAARYIMNLLEAYLRSRRQASVP